MEMVEVEVFTTTGTGIVPMKLKKEDLLSSLQAIVGGYVEVMVVRPSLYEDEGYNDGKVNLERVFIQYIHERAESMGHGEKILIFNEEGRLKGLSKNPFCALFRGNIVVMNSKDF